MKDIMSKLAELEATSPKTTKKKMLKEDATTPPMNVSDKPASLKDVFEALSVGQKPMPVVGKQGDSQQTGAGFLNVTDNSPAAQALQKAVGDLAASGKAQIVVPTQPGQQPAQQAGQPAPAGATGQQPVGQQQMKEKWAGDVKLNPAKKGMFKGKTKADLEKQLAALHKSGPHKKGSPEYTKQQELNFAIRAKSGWKESVEEESDADKTAKDTKKAFTNVKHLTKAGNPDWKKHGFKDMPVKEEQLDELSPETIKAAQAKRYGQLNQLAQTGAARAGSTTSFNAKASPQTINQFHDTETKAINRDFDDQQRTSARYDPTERDQALVSNERNRTRNMSRGNMLNLANKKLQGTANVPAKSVAEGAKVDRMVKHIEKSERKLGKSKDEAENIAWATANKRGMLDNKNKKKVKEGDIAPTQGIDTKGAGLGAGRSATTLEGKDEGKPGKNFAKIAKSAGKRYGSKEAGERVAGAVKAKLAKQGKLEEAKPDFLDLDKDGNKKEPMKKAAADKKKKKVDESMNHRISAARLEGKSHGLKGHAYHGKAYEDLEEMKAYHEGYKEGLDECYGQGVYENAPAMPAATVPGMASATMPTMEDDMEEGNAFTAALARTPKGGKFSVGGKTFTDRSSHDAKIDEYTFESLDKQLNALLTEGEDLSEGLSVSVSKGQQNSPDSVTITAQDAEADQLLQLVKHAGLGLFGDDHAEPSSAMSIQPTHGEPDEVGAGGVDIDVVDGSDDMLSLMQKLGGVESSGSDDYADEEGDELHSYGDEESEEANEDSCNECGMMEAECHCDKEKVEEVETEDQMEFEVAEDNAPDSGAQDSVADEDAEAKEDAALAGEKEEEMNESFFNLLKKFSTISESKDKESEEEDDEEEEDVTESTEEDEEDAIEESEELNEWANQAGKGPGKGTDASFEQDIEFMTKVIAGGLNKPKSTGQTTVPVIAHQDDRTHDNPADWATLAGIKK